MAKMTSWNESLGPLIGGAFAASNYRWLFYMNIPLTAIVIGIVGLFMNLKTPPGTMKEKLGRMDWYVPLESGRGLSVAD